MSRNPPPLPSRPQGRSQASQEPLGLRPAWRITGLLLLADAAWLLHDGWLLRWRDLAALGLALLAFHAPLALPRYRRDPRINATARAASLLILFQAAAAAFSYLLISLDAPLIDRQLAAADRALGFDWLALQQWLAQRPALQSTLRWAYLSGLPQLVGVVLFLGLSGRTARLAEFMHLFVLTTVMVLLLSAPFPAAGAWKHYGVGADFDLASLSHFEALRDGALQRLPLSQMQGLISMPSLHAAMALLLAHAMRGTVLQWPMLGLNLAMLASTPIEGGHYLVDLLAGSALALSLILLRPPASSRLRRPPAQGLPPNAYANPP